MRISETCSRRTCTVPDQKAHIQKYLWTWLTNLSFFTFILPPNAPKTFQLQAVCFNKAAYVIWFFCWLSSVWPLNEFVCMEIINIPGAVAIIFSEFQPRDILLFLLTGSVMLHIYHVSLHPWLQATIVISKKHNSCYANYTN